MATKEASEDKRPLRILVIGSMPPPLGGTSVSLMHLISELHNRTNIAVCVVNTSVGGIGGLVNNIRRLLIATFRIIRAIDHVDVVTLHVNTTSLHSIGLVCCILTRLWRRPFIIRKFGGTNYLNYRQPYRSIARWVVNHCDLYLAQTKMLLQIAREDGTANVAWYPTNRPSCENVVIQESKFCRRFVFMGQVRPAKGINELIRAAERFSPDVSVDVYGPFFNGFSEDTFTGLKRVRYRGVVKPERVVEVLCQYDMFVLPTYHPGEGYPGAILEAYNAGLPVVTTRWRALPEIVNETCGLLVEPHSVDELYEAMKTVVEDNKLYFRLCQGVLKKRGLFSTKLWADRFIAYCQNLVN